MTMQASAPVAQLITLRTGLAARDGALSWLRDTLKLSLRASLNRRTTVDWLELLNSHPLYRELVQIYPMMVYKIYRPYLSNALNCASRLKAIEDHYRFVLRHGLGPLTVRLARAPMILGQVEGKSGRAYQLEMHAVAPLEREGELMLRLLQDGERVFSTSFVFFQGERGMTLGVGCMQGPQDDEGQQRIKEATRDLHGLRPKNLIVYLLRQLGHAYGCDQLRLVGNANRTARTALRKGKVHADYDALWQELDAQLRPDGDYQLACAPLTAPDMAAIPSKKRSEYRKRHETLEALAAILQAGLQAPRLAPVAGPLHDFSTAGANAAPAHDAAHDDEGLRSALA
ncbi:VirK/YbjX family protein [Rugamonas brunnea]|uniref:VirK/YbjX family protein n=1 Tax=Rugamonas brunnea TaxID=2758569 RepID=UPI001E406993|nr:VirK/YbjX family protein [Rugamonas brunnea]